MEIFSAEWKHRNMHGNSFNGNGGTKYAKKYHQQEWVLKYTQKYFQREWILKYPWKYFQPVWGIEIYSEVEKNTINNIKSNFFSIYILVYFCSKFLF